MLSSDSTCKSRAFNQLPNSLFRFAMNRLGNNLIHWGPNKNIVSEFDRRGVEYLLVGGLAVAWYCGERQADDMDLLVNSTRENPEKVSAALESLGQGQQPKDAFARPDVLAKMNQHYLADIFTQPSGGLSFDELWRGSIVGRLFEIPVKIPSIPALITMKEHAMEREGILSDKHLKDIEALTKVWSVNVV